MKKSDFMRSEFIGLDVSVLSSQCYAGIAGRVVDESKNTLTVISSGTEKTVPKSGNEFRFTYEGKQIDIMGSEILHRPEDRIKKVR